MRSPERLRELFTEIWRDARAVRPAHLLLELTRPPHPRLLRSALEQIAAETRPHLLVLQREVVQWAHIPPHLPALWREALRWWEFVRPDASVALQRARAVALAALRRGYADASAALRRGVAFAEESVAVAALWALGVIAAARSFEDRHDFGEIARSFLRDAALSLKLQRSCDWVATEGSGLARGAAALRRAAARDVVALRGGLARGVAALRGVAARDLAALVVRGVVALRGAVAGVRGGQWRVPGGVRVLLVGGAVAAVVLGIGFRTAPQPAGPGPLAQASPTAAGVPVTAAQPTETVGAQGERVVPLAWLNPITGPDRPPLPEDERGPYGSRRTTGTNEVALTFDDGPDPRFTPEVLELLREYRIKATFCVIGVNVVEFPELVRAIDAEGHTLCNHSWGHDTGLGNRGIATIASDMARTNAAIRAAAPNARISYFRHPGGMWTTTAVNSARQLGMTSLHWDVDPKDWLKPGARAISAVVNTNTTPGAIVLMHDGGGDRRGTMDALRSILPYLTAHFALVALPPGMDPPRRYGIDLPAHLGQQ